MQGRSTTARVASRRRSRISSHTDWGGLIAWLFAAPLRALKRSAGFILGYAALVLAIFGVFRDPTANTTEQLLALAGLSAVMLVRLFERLQRTRVDNAQTAWADLELGTLFVAAAFVLVELTGGPSGFLYPLLYALVAFLVAFHPIGQSIYFLLLILGTEAGVLLLQPGGLEPTLYLSHASFVLLFGFLYAMFLRSEVVHSRSTLKREVESHLDGILSEAQAFRLTSGLSFEGRGLTAEDLQTRRRIGSVQAIHDSLYNVLAVAERALTPHTVALLWMDMDDRRLKVKELRSSSDYVVEHPVGAGEGVVGAITKRREPLVLTNLKPGYPGLVYYRRPEGVTDFAGVPVMEGRHLRGVLVADRKNGDPFDDSDVEVMTTIAAEIVRAVQVERIFADMDSEKYQRERFYEASRDFNQALTVEQVAQVAIRAAMRVSQASFGAIAVATHEENEIYIADLRWDDKPEQRERLLGQFFAPEEGLVGAAIKAQHPLPYGTARTASQPIFDAQHDVDVEHVKVLPLIVLGRGVGALVLGHDRDSFMSMDLLDMCKVIADHAAIAIANAQMYDRMEKMATTDGLTSLTNHRQFQELFDQYLARAERYARRLSLILCDIDHFKSVNDTYGHPVGDMVLKRVARVLETAARKTDVVARYGGEEFAILMEETDKQGATQMAERIRLAVAAEELITENGRFSCTLSLGIATYPDDAQQKARITEGADQALYEAKRGGRNRAVQFSPRRRSAASR